MEHSANPPILYSFQGCCALRGNIYYISIICQPTLSKMDKARLLIHSLLGMVVGETGAGGQTSDLRLEDEMENKCKITNARPAR